MRARSAALARRVLRFQFIRFLAVGGLNTLFGYVVYLVGLSIRLSPEMALLLATCVGSMFNYLTTGRLVFRHQTLDQLVPFIGTYALLYLINLGAIRLVLSAGLPPALAQAVLIPPMAVLSFTLFRFLVFRRRHVQPLSLP